MRGLAQLAHQALDAPERRISEWDIPWNRSVLGLNGRRVTPDTALSLSAVWACETLIADAVATLPADTYRKRDTVREETPPPGWVETPNPYLDRVDYETQRLLSILGWGNAYSLLVRRSGSSDPLDPVIERWPLHPYTVDVRREVPGRAEVSYFVAGAKVPAGNIQHVPGYMLPGALKGMSVVEHAARSMGLGESAEDFGAKFYENGIVPSGALEIPALPAEASVDVVDRIRDNIAERYSGAGNAFRPIALTGGTKWKQITVDPAAAQFLETRKFQTSEIARWFRVPPHMIGDVERSTSWGTGIEQQALGFARHTLTPWIVRLERADSRLLPRGQYLRLNLSSFVRADLRTRFAAYQMGRNMGVYSADEVRAFEDMPPLPDGQGEIYLQPLNMGEAGAEPPEPPPTPPTPGDQQGDQ